MTMLQMTVREMSSMITAVPRNAALEMAIGFRTQTLGVVCSALVSSYCHKCAQNRAAKQYRCGQKVVQLWPDSLMYSEDHNLEEY